EAYNNKDYAAAERLSGEAIQAFPSHVLAYYLQGQAALAQSKWPAAVAAFGKVIELYPASFAGHRELGVAYQGLGKTDDAMRAYPAALKIRPEDDELRLHLAVMLQKGGHEDKALPVLQELARRESKIPEVYTTIARLNFESGDFAGAEKAFVKSLSLRDDGW